MAKGVFITFEGSEGCGKSTQIEILVRKLRAVGYRVRTSREPGGTPIGEEIRTTLKHSKDNHAMTAEAELLLMNAARAQLVREVIRPALETQATSGASLPFAKARSTSRRLVEIPGIPGMLHGTHLLATSLSNRCSQYAAERGITTTES